MPRIVVEGPDGKKYAFPDTMPREEINAFMKQRYGTKARNETVQDYLARVVREQDATKARAKSVTKEATAAGRAEGERAAERMGVDNPLMMAFAAPAIGLAQQSAGRTVYDREGTMLPDEAAALAAVNAAGFLVPGMVNKQFGERAAEGRRQQPGASFAGDLAGGAIGGEMINLGLQKAGQAIAPGVSAIGRMFKGKPAPEPPLTLGPESRIMPVDRPDALPGDDVAMAQALDQWTPPVEQQVRPMGFDPRPRVAKRETRNEPFFDERLTPSQNKAVEMRKNGYTAEEIADEMDTTRNTIDQLLFQAKTRGVDIGPAARDLRRNDVLELAKKGLSNKQIEDRLGMKSDQAKVFLAQERARLKKAGEEIPDWLAPKSAPRGGGRPPKQAGLLTERGRDAVEQTFGAAYMSGTGSVAGQQYDFNGDGQIDNTDIAIGSGIGLAAFASPLALRKVTELGGRLKGTKAQGMAPSAGKPPALPENGYDELKIGNASVEVTRVDDKMTINRLKVPENARGQGEASRALDAVLQQADEQGLTVFLTADPVGTGGLSKTQLEAFYKRHGFVRNKGRNKDFSSQAGMIRLPQKSGSDQ